jgi:kynurenine formamidase
MTARRIIDLSHTVSAETPVFPGDAAVEIQVTDATSRPSVAGERHMNCSRLNTSLHTGTHMDAPFHFMHDGASIDRVDLSHCIGPSLMIPIPSEIRVIDVPTLAPWQNKLRVAHRVILNTGWHRRWGEPDYFTAHPVISGEAARFLVDQGVLLLGVDTPSVDRDPYDAHLTLLGAGRLIVENLTNLDQIHAELFDLVATPLRILGRDGSPVRAVAIVGGHA